MLPKLSCSLGSDNAAFIGGKVVAAALKYPAQRHPKPMLVAASSRFENQ